MIILYCLVLHPYQLPIFIPIPFFFFFFFFHQHTHRLNCEQPFIRLVFIVFEFSSRPFFFFFFFPFFVGKYSVFRTELPTKKILLSTTPHHTLITHVFIKEGILCPPCTVNTEQFTKKKIAIYSSEEIFTFPHTSVPFRNEWHFTPRAKRVG